MKTFAKTLTALGAALILTAAPATAASAASSSSAGGKGGWVPYVQPDFTVPAGQACSFELHGKVVYDKEFTRVVKRFPDGSPKVEEFRGPLGVVFSNTATQKSAFRDATGTLRATRDGAGTTEFVFGGNGIAPIFAGSEEPGIYVVSGHHEMIAHPDGTREFTRNRGTVENMCQTLA